MTPRRQTAIPRGWEGPSYREGRDVPCHACDTTGIAEDGVQTDADDFLDCLCGNCEGSGIEPYHKAGGRYTGYPLRRDPLEAVASRRRALIANKTRDFAAEAGSQHWPEQSQDIIDFSTGRPVRILCAAEWNERERRHADRMLRLRHELEVRDAMKPTLIELSVAETFAKPRASLVEFQFDMQDYARKLLGIAA